MNPFRCLVDLALELRKQVLDRYATGNPYTQKEADALSVRLKSLAADCRVAARRMGCSGAEEAIEALLHATVDLFNAPARLREPYSRANKLDAAVPPVARLADDFDADSRRSKRESRRSNKRPGQLRKGEKDKARSEQLPPAGSRFTEKDVPADFREGGKPDGIVLSAPYLAESANWFLGGSYLTKHFGPDKELKHRIKVGSAYAYCYAELLILRDRKTANDAEREEDG